ncbi:NADP-dependent oxidoreductase [Oceanibacterium hippocampi]|uniref:NADPH-dependent curcumin reductase n=1 Tax=Oceanibacterium hippocampi TaxID=745714 RepID=A0A1Y5TAC1_9PROT|nr:NADP-dependent oxidoreductase [Oceanibacterium hippocampi]SLN59533.1 NADPH-dependent curcumin reductase [Oceanibacterium hippocampi]
MSAGKNRQIVLAARPSGAPKNSDFALKETPIPSPGAGQILLRTIHLSLDPYMRGRMNDGPSYAKPVQIGDVMTGAVVAEVMESDNPDFPTGTIVEGRTGWQEYSLSDGSDVRRIDPSLAPISTALGVLGMPGMTAYTGLLTIGQPKAGETVAVAAASGAVGGLVGQIAKIKGARAVGIAGSREKCDFVVNELGFDACVSHRDQDLAGSLKGACPSGIDVYFENVGGPVFGAVLPLMNEFSRMPVCGLIAHYNATSLPEGPDRLPILMRQILTKRILVRGFIVWDFAEQEQQFLTEMAGWVRDGSIKYKEDFVDGLENAVAAFQGLLEGRNFGKLIVRVGAEP